MRRSLMLGILCLVATTASERVGRVLATAGQAVPQEKVILQFFKEPQVLPDFSVRTLDGRTLRAGHLRGKVTLVNFWATWCPPCRAEIPDLIALQKKYPDALQVLGISEDVGSPQLVRQFIKEHRINYPVAMATPELARVFTRVTAHRQHSFSIVRSASCRSMSDCWTHSAPNTRRARSPVCRLRRTSSASIRISRSASRTPRRRKRFPGSISASCRPKSGSKRCFG